jgi:recombination protein RecA
VSEAGGIAAFIDASHAFDRFYAEKSAWMSTTLDLAADNGEQALQIADQPS